MFSHRDIETEQAHRPTNDPVAVMPEPAQRSARNDPDMRDGDSAHGNPNEAAPEELNDSDRDVGDSTLTADAMPEEEAGMHEHDPDEEAGLAHTRAEFGPERNADTHLAPEPVAPSGPGPRDIPNRTIDSPGREQVDEQLRKSFAHEAGAAHPTPPSTAASGAAPGEAELPVAYFTKLTVPEIIRKAENLTPDELRTLLDFERAHRNRKTLVTQLERWARGDRRGGRRRAAPMSSDTGGSASS
jgi:hypothetical protein